MHSRLVKSLVTMFALLSASVLMKSSWSLMKQTYALPTIIVPDDFPTIQEAINAAAEGSTISVRPGTYNESIAVSTSQLKITGSSADSTVIAGPGRDHTVHLAKGANNITVSGFTIKGTNESPWSGIYVRSLYNTIENNVITGHHYGIHIYDSLSNTLKNNSLQDNTYNLAVWGLYLPHFIQDIDTSNQIEEKPVYYMINQRNTTYVQTSIGYLALINCSNISVENLELSDNQCGLLLAYTSNSTITKVRAEHNEYGLYMVCSNRNVIRQNEFNNNSWGTVTISADNNTFASNMIFRNKNDGIRLSHSYPLLSKYSEWNTLTSNNISANGNGIYLEASHTNTICGNLVNGNLQDGIVLDESTHNTVYENTVWNSSRGVRIYTSNGNILSNNNFINNTVQVEIYPFTTSANKWNNSYPSGGNFWTDYEGKDTMRSPYQNVTGSDGIGDTSCTMDQDNQDFYPLMGIFSSFNITSELQIQTISNSTITDFSFNGTAVSFNIEGEDTTSGFCRVCIPQHVFNGSYRVFINNIEVTYDLLPWSDNTDSHLYLNYNHSAHIVVIIPELRRPLILLLLLGAALTIIMSDRAWRKHKARRYAFPYIIVAADKEKAQATTPRLPQSTLPKR